MHAVVSAGAGGGTDGIRTNSSPLLPLCNQSARLRKNGGEQRKRPSASSTSILRSDCSQTKYSAFNFDHAR